MPEDITTNPADQYVSDFVAGISKLKLLFAHTVMQPLEAYEQRHGPIAKGHAPVATPDDDLDNLIALSVGQDHPVLIKDDGNIVGVVSKDAILFYYRSPEWLHAAYDLSPLTEPAFTADCMDLQLDGEDWLEASTASCQTPDAQIYVSFSKSLEQRNPAAAKFLSQIQLDPDVLNTWILKIGRDEMDP